MAQRRLRTEEPPPAWVTATRVQRIVDPSGHTEEYPLQSPSVVPTATHRGWGGGAGFEEIRKERCKGIKIVKGLRDFKEIKAYVLPAIGVRNSYLNWRSYGI